MVASPIKLTTQTLIAVVASVATGAMLAIVGARALVVDSMPTLLGIAFLVLGALGVALGAATWYGKRAAWAILAATWGVVGFCAFFAAPKLIHLPRLESVTIEMELQMGRKAAEAKIDDRNLVIRAENLAVCSLFALPFALMCVGLVAGSRELEKR